MLSQIVLVIHDFVGGSPFSCGSWQDWQDHRPAHNSAHAGLRPHTIMNHFYMNNDVIGQFSFLASFLRPSTGISASSLIFCMISRADHHILVDCSVLTDELAFFCLCFLLYRSTNFHFMFSF